MNDQTAKNVLVVAELVQRQSALIQSLMTRLIETEALTEALLKVLIEERHLTAQEQAALAARVQTYVETTKGKLTAEVLHDMAAWAQKNPSRQ